MGGAIWTSFPAAFVLALFTAFAYAELVSKYPRAAGAALYTHRAFQAPFFTFVVDFKEGESVFLAIVGGTALFFYAMIGFEDSVNVAEKDRLLRPRCDRSGSQPSCSRSSPSWRSRTAR